MKVYLGGTEESSWREYLTDQLDINYFDPTKSVSEGKDTLSQLRQYERRHCEILLHVITPRMNGFFNIAEVTDDALKRPDRTVFCYLSEDTEYEFSLQQVESLNNIGRRVERNGALWLQTLEEVIDYLNSAKRQNDEVELDTTIELDTFLSYGRKQSKKLVNELNGYLKSQKLKSWFDDGLIPMEIGHLDEVNLLISKAHNFIFIISSHSVRSEYTLRELEYARKLNKRIIPIMHVQPELYWENIPEEIKGDKIFYFTPGKEEELFQEIANASQHELEFIKTHTRVLQQALDWETNSYDPKKLLYGRELKEISKWKQTIFQNESPPIRTSLLQLKFISISESQSIEKRIIHFLNKYSSRLIDHKNFDKVIGLISLANPVSLLPQVYNIAFLDVDMSSISEYTFGLFAILNFCFALVGIKQENLGVFISMFISMLLNIFIVLAKINTT